MQSASKTNKNLRKIIYLVGKIGINRVNETNLRYCDITQNFNSEIELINFDTEDE